MFRSKATLCLLGLWALCVLALLGLASCAEATNDGGPQSFSTHLNGSYSFEAVSASVH